MREKTTTLPWAMSAPSQTKRINPVTEKVICRLSEIIVSCSPRFFPPSGSVALSKMMILAALMNTLLHKIILEHLCTSERSFSSLFFLLSGEKLGLFATSHSRHLLPEIRPSPVYWNLLRLHLNRPCIFCMGCEKIMSYGYKIHKSANIYQQGGEIQCENDAQ